MKKAAILLLLFAAVASAQQKQRVAVLPSVGDLEPQGLILLTDKVRELATKNLPMEDFNILKQDVITKMIGEEELYRSCKEGVCIGDLAKKTNANYGARCDVIKFENNLVLKFELYSVNEEAIFETFTDYDVNDFRGMLASLEARLPDAFKRMIRSLKKNERLDAAQTAPKPEPRKTYTVAAAASPPEGGSVSRSPNYAAYSAGTRVTVKAVPRRGYTFAGWDGGPASASSSVTVAVKDNLTLTAKFQRIPAPEPAAPKPPPAVAAGQPKPKDKPYESPGVPQKPKNRSSVGAGVFFANDAGGGLKWNNSEELAMPYFGGGAYLYLDFVYAEFLAGFSGGGGKWKSADASYRYYLPDMRRTYMNIGAFVKYPIGTEKVKIFPLTGIEYEVSISAELNGNSNVHLLHYPNDTDLSALWFKLGGGIDIGVSESAYLRTELLYGWRTANTYELDSRTVINNYRAKTRPGSGFTFKTGIGVKI